MTENAQGVAVGPDGAVYLSGNLVGGGTTTGVVRRGRPDGAGGFVWTAVATTEPFPRNDFGPLNHLVNALAVSPDGASLFINSGSRTDHGEASPAGSTHPGTREVPLTSAILRVPADATDLVLPNDEAALRAGGFLYADGVRNTFSLAFDAAGRLYGAENSGDRDDGDELNWLREEHHYGFPWRMGDHDTPQRFPGYDPAADRLLNPEAGTVQMGFFYDDPAYPAPPADVAFTDPVRNVGPDADAYRDADTGAIRDASDDGIVLQTLTPHSSPLGLAFDAAGALPAPYTGDGLMLRFSSSAPGANVLFEPFADGGEDLVHLDFSDPETAAVTRIVRGFVSPTDAVLVGRSLVVVEIGGTAGLWAIDFTGPLAAEPSPDEALNLRVGPNPFADRLQVALRLAAAGTVAVDVFDALGRRVAAVDAGGRSAGEQAMTLDARDWPAGLYLLRVRAGDVVATRRIVRR